MYSFTLFLIFFIEQSLKGLGATENQGNKSAVHIWNIKNFIQKSRDDKKEREVFHD